MVKCRVHSWKTGAELRPEFLELIASHKRAIKHSMVDIVSRALEAENANHDALENRIFTLTWKDFTVTFKVLRWEGEQFFLMITHVA